MYDNTILKAGFGGFVALFLFLFNRLNLLIIVLASFIVLDYLLGVTVGILTDGFDKRKGAIGALKKLGYIFLILIAMLLDITITYVSQSASLGINSNGLFCYAIMCYLIGNEGLSCLNSLARLGLPVPQFLKKAFRMLESASEQANPNDSNQ